MLDFFKDGEQTTPEKLISELTYGTYAYNRSIGMTADAALGLWPETGAAMEERYQREHKHD